MHIHDRFKRGLIAMGEVALEQLAVAEPAERPISIQPPELLDYARTVAAGHREAPLVVGPNIKLTAPTIPHQSAIFHLFDLHALAFKAYKAVSPGDPCVPAEGLSVLAFLVWSSEHGCPIRFRADFVLGEGF